MAPFLSDPVDILKINRTDIKHGLIDVKQSDVEEILVLSFFMPPVAEQEIC